MPKKPGYNMDFERIIGFGENPKGFTSETVNGTAKHYGVGWNRVTYPSMAREQQAPDGELWKEGRRHNRTGE